MKIHARLMLLTTSVALVGMIVALGTSSYLTRSALDVAAEERLSLALSNRYDAIQRRFDTMEAELKMLAVSRAAKSYLLDFSEGYAKLGKTAQTQLQQSYLPSGRDGQLTSGLSATPYGQGINLASGFFQQHLKAYGWQDILLVDPLGNVVFSVLKEADFGTNLVTGPWKDTKLAAAVLPLLHDAVPGTLSFTDYALYPASRNEPASFLAAPVFDEIRQTFVGVLVIRLPKDPLNQVTLNTTGMGETGEVFVVGKDGWMLSDSRMIDADTTFKKNVNTKASRSVLSGKTGKFVALDYRGVEVVVAFKPLIPFADALGDRPRWGVIAKIDRAEVLHPYEHLRKILWLVGALLALFAIFLGYWGARSISRPLVGIKDALTRLTRNESVDVPSLERKDEIGEIAMATEGFRQVTEQVAHDHWLAENVSALTTAVSAETTVNRAADQVLHLLCDLLEVPVGAIYLLEQERFQRVSAHGLARRSQAADSFEMGDGVLGQCARDAQAQVLSPVPAGLSVISTGLAEFPPHELVLYPLAHKNNVLAVLELAATKSLTPNQHEFLQAATAALGLHFSNLQAAEHNEILLAETTRQSAELRTTSLYARSLLEAGLDPLVTISPDGRIMDVNSATENVTGVARGSLIGSDFSDYFTEPEMAQAGYKQVFTQGFVTDYPLAIRHASGRITDVLYNASVFRDVEGQVAGIFAVARDVTEKKRAEAKLREQQDALMRSNEEMRALTEELQSQAEEMKAQNEELKSSQEELRSQQEEVQHKNQVLESQSAQLEELISEANQKADDLARANQYKSEFLANMSHELRTPLNSVLILSRNLAENDEDNLTPDQVESATVISESGTQLLILINDILDLSKIEAGKMELLKESFLLEDLVTYLRRVFLPQAERKQIAFDIELAPDLPPNINTDRQRLTQVLSNLLSNAIKFTDAGNVTLNIGRQGDNLEIEVKDSGIGIPSDKLELIFGAFQQVDGSTSRKYGGSGLGLAISRHLAELLGGKIDVKSQPGHGSSFTLRLLDQFTESNQAGTVRLPAVQTPPRQAPTNGSSAILVVEDDVRLLTILGRMIKGLGFTAICVESAEQALLALKKEVPAGVLLDLGLPKMSGMEMLRLLKEDQRTAQVPVYIMSGATDNGEAKVLGALGFLKKPVTRDTIAAAIRVMVNASESVGSATQGKRILLVDDIPADIKFIQKLFKSDAVEVVLANSGNDGIGLLQAQHFDTVILDLQLHDMSGFDWLHQASHLLNPPPVIVYTERDLTEAEVFELKEVTEGIVKKGKLNSRLREEVLLATQGVREPGKVSTAGNQTFAGKKLLLVDDDARNLFALTKVLRARGFTIEIAPDGARALALLQESRFDAVLTDIMMPDMDGYALIREIRTSGNGEIPIIAITAKAMQGDDALCLQAGATAYLAKPVDVNRLLEMLDGLV